MTAATQKPGMDEDTVAWYENWFTRSLPKNEPETATATTTHTKDKESTAIPHGSGCAMTEDIEEAVVEDMSNSNHNYSGDPRRRSSLLHEHHEHEDSRDTSGSREEVPPSRNSRSSSLEEAPRSGRGLPTVITTPSAKKTNIAAQLEQRLLHRVLHNIPMQFRFGCNGILSNVLFMVAYNFAVANFEKVAASTVYLVLYFIFIPIGHAMASVLVFGWPEKYASSLLSNFPIGLTAMAIGGALTAYLDRIDFNEIIEEWIRDNFTFSHMPPRNAANVAEKSEFYSSVIVLVVTSVWTYVLSVYINTPRAKSEKKEL
jgi:hypothetical protein